MSAVVLAATVAFSAATAIGRAAEPAQPLYALPFLHVGPASGPAGLPQVMDPAGRVVMLRGVNVNGLEDYWADSATPLATPYPTTPAAYAGGACPRRNPAVESMAVCALDFPQLQALGYDSIRLGVSWSLLEPAPGVISTSYIDRIQQVVEWARSAGLYVVIDMHQDAWSKYVYTPAGQPCPPPFKTVGGFHESDGAPAWASTALTPTCALNGTRELDTAVQENFQKLWSDLPGPDNIGLQEHYAAVMVALARRFGGDSTVAGYEIINEPSPGLTAPDVMAVTELFPFYAKVIGTVTSAVPGFQQLFFVEPDITRDITDKSLALVPWSTFSSYRNVVYSPHIYTRVFTPDAALNAPVLDAAFPLDGGYRSSVADAVNLGLPLWVGEFGNDVADDDAFLRAHYAYSDSDTIGNSLWVWKADLAAGFSVYHGPFGDGSAFPSRLKFTSRVYPLFTAGVLDAVDYQPDTGIAQVRGTSAVATACGARALATVVFVPSTATGRVTVVNAGLEVLAVPGGRLAFVYPAGGAYSMSVGPAGDSAVTGSCIPAVIDVTGGRATPTTSTAGPAGAEAGLLVALAAMAAAGPGVRRRRRERARREA